MRRSTWWSTRRSANTAPSKTRSVRPATLLPTPTRWLWMFCDSHFFPLFERFLNFSEVKYEDDVVSIIETNIDYDHDKSEYDNHYDHQGS